MEPLEAPPTQPEDELSVCWCDIPQSNIEMASAAIHPEQDNRIGLLQTGGCCCKGSRQVSIFVLRTMFSQACMRTSWAHPDKFMLAVCVCQSHSAFCAMLLLSVMIMPCCEEGTQAFCNDVLFKAMTSRIHMNTARLL